MKQLFIYFVLGLFVFLFFCFFFGKTKLRSILFLHINLIFNLNIFYACFHYYLTILIYFSFHFILKKINLCLSPAQAIELPGSVPASSSWCPDELVEMVRCKNSIGQTLLPIFYGVNPSDVRKQIETFAKAFAKHEDQFQAKMERVHKWREALIEAANYSGWDLQNLANGYYICYYYMSLVLFDTLLLLPFYFIFYLLFFF